MDSGVGPWGRAAEAHFVVVVVCSPQWWCGVVVLLSHSLTHSLSYLFFSFVLTRVARVLMVRSLGFCDHPL